MRVYSKQLSIKTNRRVELVNITQEVQRVVSESGVSNGLANVFCTHTTMGVFVNEDEPRLRSDIDNMLERLAPMEGQYEHNIHDDNAHAHLRSILLSPSVTLLVVKGRLQLGTWQSVFCAEFDGPRTRNIVVQALGE